MTQTLQTTSPIERLDTTSLVKAGRDALGMLVKDYGIVYVSSITRDGCSGCEEQKPLFQKLAEKIDKIHPGKTKFSNIHIQFLNDDSSQSQEAKGVFGHASYPTYMIHVKSTYGILEHYRAAYPSMEELEKQIVGTFELADYYEKEKENRP